MLFTQRNSAARLRQLQSSWFTPPCPAAAVPARRIHIGLFQQHFIRVIYTGLPSVRTTSWVKHHPRDVQQPSVHRDIGDVLWFAVLLMSSGAAASVPTKSWCNQPVPVDETWLCAATALAVFRVCAVLQKQGIIACPGGDIHWCDAPGRSGRRGIMLVCAGGERVRVIAVGSGGCGERERQLMRTWGVSRGTRFVENLVRVGHDHPADPGRV